MFTTIFDLEDLEDVLDQLVAEEDTNNNNNHFFYEDEFTEFVLHVMDDYVTNNPKAITEPDFEDNFILDIQDLVKVQMFPLIRIDYEKEQLEDIVEEIADLFYESIMPSRSHPESILLKPVKNNEKIQQIQKQIDYLTAIPQPAQRTPEWYEFRNNLITASNAYKAFENDNTKNQLIYEKCLGVGSKGTCNGIHPLTNEANENDENDVKVFIIQNSSASNNFVGPNINSPMHWGQKYEPISVMIYEDMYKTKVGDFGCIKHRTYPFLGASPDGINIDPLNPRFGRMLEIKNIVNREIDGIPKMEYWIQMQLQMETCDLDECDFLETKFVEYENEAAYLEDQDQDQDQYQNQNLDQDDDNVDDDDISTKSKTSTRYTGIIMYFSNPHLYEYAPLGISQEDFALWEEAKMEEHKENIWIKNIYWKAEIISCVLVERNRKWFNDNINELADVWSTIEKERVSGYSHRVPNKRVKKETSIKSSGCLINLNKETGKIELSSSLVAEKSIPNILSMMQGHSSSNSNTNSNTNTITVLKIRTESFDDSKKNYTI